MIYSKRHDKDTKDFRGAVLEMQAHYIRNPEALNNAFQALLEPLLALTDSEWGFVGEVHREADGRRVIKLYEARRLSRLPYSALTEIVAPGRERELNISDLHHSALSTVIQLGEPILSNTPGEGILGSEAEGEPLEFDAFLGIPLVMDGEVQGVLGLAALTGGYNETLLPALKPVAESCNSILQSHRRNRRRRMSEEALRGSRDEMRQLIKAMPDIAWTACPDGSLDGYNRRFYEYTGLEEGAGRSWAWKGVVHQDDLPKVLETWNLALQEGRPVEMEYRLRRADGAYRWHSSRARPVRDSQGQVRKWIGTMLDITQRKEAECRLVEAKETMERHVRERTAQLETANRELEAFTYSVSHDLRAPLRAMDGFSQALLKEYGGALDADGKEYLKRIVSASKKMSGLIEALLRLSRLTRASLHKKTIDLTAMCKSIAEELQQREPEREIRFEIREGLEAFGDPHLIQDVLQNFLENAWKFTKHRKPALIEVGYHREGGKKAFFVRDNGVGFDMNYVEKLFGAFQRLHRVDDYPGTGIGLASIQRILHRHGGNAWAEAEEGKGATFFFTLGTSSQ